MRTPPTALEPIANRAPPTIGDNSRSEGANISTEQVAAGAQ